MVGHLSEGAIAAIMQQGDTSIKPILQVINIRPITTGNSPPRYRLLMSDGLNTLSSFMLATQLNPLVEEERLSSNCICQINRFIVNTLKDGRRVVILMELEVLKSAEAVGSKIGNPVPYNEGHGQQPVVPPPVSAASPPTSRPQQQNGSPGMASTASKAFGASKTFGKAGGTSQVNSSGGTQAKVVPIASLTPYQSKWTICARVTNKSQIRTWSNSRGEGKLFSIELVDESGEIRATAFNEQADKFFPLIDVNKVYYFSKGTLKIANKQFTAVKNDYEMTFNNETSVMPCEDGHHLPTVQFDFTGIGDLESKSKDSLVDIIGICKNYEDVTKIIVKSNNREVSKRNIYLMDMSGKVVNATLWGDDADKFDGSRQPVMAIKGARVSDFGGRSLSVLSSSTIIVNPDIPEAYKLRGWFDSEGQALDGISISDLKSGGAGGSNTNWKTLYEVKSENLGQGDKPDYFSSVATVVYLRKENCMYQACPTQDCNKKVIDQQNGLYRCEKCDSEFPNFKYRMILSVNIADFQENQWVTCFQESAEAILGQSTAYLGELKEKNEQAFEEVFQNANFRSFTFRIRVKLETYNGKEWRRECGHGGGEEEWTSGGGISDIQTLSGVRGTAGFRKTVSHGLMSLPLPARPPRGKAAGAGLEMEPGGWSGAVLRQLRWREQSGSRANPADQRGLGLSPGPGADSSPRTLLPPSHCRLCQFFFFFFSKTICSAFMFSIVRENAIPFG